MDQPILAKNMKWPHCKGSLIPENAWNTGLEDLMRALFDAADERFWCHDTDLKYLNLRIDTRDNAFILSVDGGGDGAPKVRIDPQRVPDAIAGYRAFFKGLSTDQTKERRDDT